MSRSIIARIAGLATAVLALTLVVGLAGCSKGSSGTPSNAPVGALTAKQTLPTAVSALATKAPDAKLLLVTTARIVTATETPVWQYLFGSPKTGQTYSVAVMAGKALAQDYGSAGLVGKEWDVVPPVDQWKVDSDVAIEKARAVYAAGGKKDAAYIIGMVTYVPKSATKSKLQAMVWSVSFDPTTRGTAPTSTVNVNAITGAAAFAK